MKKRYVALASAPSKHAASCLLPVAIRQRLQRIRENRELLISLGIDSELHGLSSLSKDEGKEKGEIKSESSTKRRKTVTAGEGKSTRTLRSAVKKDPVQEQEFPELREEVNIFPGRGLFFPETMSYCRRNRARPLDLIRMLEDPSKSECPSLKCDLQLSAKTFGSP